MGQWEEVEGRVVGGGEGWGIVGGGKGGTVGGGGEWGSGRR